MLLIFLDYFSTFAYKCVAYKKKNVYFFFESAVKTSSETFSISSEYHAIPTISFCEVHEMLQVLIERLLFLTNS